MPTREDAVRLKVLAATKSKDLRDLLHHIAWTDVLRPAMEQERSFYQTVLVNATLGIQPTIKDHNGEVHVITKEQLAGRIQGIDFTLTLIERILTKGEKALDDLDDLGYNIT